MKSINFLIGIITTSTAVVTAIATAKNYTPNKIYYEAVPGDKSSCTETTIDIPDCTILGPNICISYEINSFSFLKPVFADRYCDEVLRRP